MTDPNEIKIEVSEYQEMARALDSRDAEASKLRADVERLTVERATIIELLGLIEGSTVANVGPYEEIRKLAALANRYVNQRTALAETKPAAATCPTCGGYFQFYPGMVIGPEGRVKLCVCKRNPKPTTPEPHPEYLRGLEDAAKLADEGKHDEWSPDYIGRMIRQLAACAAPLATEKSHGP